MIINDHLDVVIPADDIRVRVVAGENRDTLIVETATASRAFVFAKDGRFNGSADCRTYRPGGENGIR
jgi:hypothetical protein